MKVEIGHKGVPHGNGERTVTTFVIPEGVSEREALASIHDALPYHLEEGTTPYWIESDSDNLQALLADDLGCSPKKNKRPKSWEGV